MRRLWYHGKVDTMVPGKDRQQAIGVEDGTIVFVGSDRDALALPWDEKTDLEGRQVLPGFHDTHMHLLLYALFQDSLPLAGVPSIQEMIRRGRDKLAQTGASYLLGMGWNQETLAEERMPTRADLDQISREVPVCLLRCCAHVAACNTPMLERLKTLTGVEESVLEKVDFDQGLLREEAMRLYMQVVPPLSDEEAKSLIRRGQADANAKGLTCVHSDDLQVLPGMDSVRLVRLFREMEQDGELTLRVYEQCLLAPSDFERFLSVRSDPQDRESLFHTGPRKLLQDGSLGARTALLREGYAQTTRSGRAWPSTRPTSWSSWWRPPTQPGWTWPSTSRGRSFGAAVPSGGSGPGPGPLASGPPRGSPRPDHRCRSAGADESSGPPGLYPAHFY